MIAGVQGRAGQVIARVLGGFRYGSTAFMKRRSKHPDATAARTHRALEDELPDHYGQSRVVLMVIDPYHLHTYWELTAQDRLDAKKRLNPPDPDQPLTWVLRFYDVTGVEPDTSSAHSFFDVVVKPGARSWYVELWSANKSYFAELGPRADGRFVPVCRSRPVWVPPAERWSPPAPVEAQDEPAFEQPALASEPHQVLVSQPVTTPPEQSEAPPAGPALAPAEAPHAEISPAEQPFTRLAAQDAPHGPARESSGSASAPEQKLEPSRSVSLTFESSGSGSAWLPPK